MFSLVCAAGWDAVVGGQCRVNGPWGSRSPRPPPPFQVPNASWRGGLKTPVLTFPGGSDGKASAYGAGKPGSIPESGRSGEGNGNQLQYFAWKIPWTEEPGRLQSM